MTGKEKVQHEVFLLEDDNKRVWGVFDDRVLLYSMYQNLVSALGRDRALSIRMLSMNTNTVIRQWLTPQEIYDTFHPEKAKRPTEQVSGQVNVTKEVRSEWKKLQARHSEFKSNLDVLKKMLGEKLLSVDSPIDEVPELLRDKFYVLKDIIKLDIPQEDAFGYFMDRYYYQPNRLLHTE
jgi:hypothetical protein